MAKWSRADLVHEEAHVRALRRLGVSAKVYEDNQGLYTIQTGGRRLSRVEEAAVHLAADGGFFDGRAAEDRRLAAKLVGSGGKDRREAEKLARKLRVVVMAKKPEKPRKEMNLDNTKVVKEIKAIWREGPKCTCGNRTSRCRCPGA